MAPRTLVATALALSALAVAAGTGAPLDAQSRAEVVGVDGELYMLRQGSYGELFPDGGLASPANAALALDIVHADQNTERLLVPGTETDDLETSPSALFEDDSGTLFVLWQTSRNYIHSWLSLIGFRDGEWTEPIEITGSPFGWKSSPQLAVTRDSFTTRGTDDASRSWKRTLVHLIWWEDGAAGPEVLYTPVVLIDGEYTGWNPVYRLDDLAMAAGVPFGMPNPELAEAPRLDAGVNGQSVVIAFVPAGSTQLVTIALELLPGELGVLADSVRAQIIEVGRAGGPDGALGSLADKARAQIIEVGARLKLHPGVSSYVADQVHDRILASEPGRPVAALADDVRAQIIEVGAHVTDRGFDRLSAASTYGVIELPGAGSGDGTGTEPPPDLIRVAQVSSRPAPQTGDEPASLYLSKDGRGVVAAWQEGNALLYRESRGNGWTEARRLQLGNELDLEHAQSLLERRADERSGPPAE
jgi:hypothetical protein